MVATALTIAGSDSGGGAGIQADLKTFSALGVYGASVITAVTAQNTRAVTDVHPVPNATVAAQIAAVLGDIRVDCIKIGMLGDAVLIATVAQALEGYRGPVVLDPVMVAKSGARLLPDAARAALIAHLLPRADLLTPNLPEAAALLGCSEAETDAEMQAQGAQLRDMGARAVLMKGGHGQGATCTDWLIADEVTRLDATRIATRNTHGTGCTLSSAIAAGLAKGLTLTQAVETAHGWLHCAIRAADALEIGQGHGPVHHFHEVWT
ncbi:hydroxymethylpyrimidine/phosphomethylpyrimidine kinase [Roseovarius sp. A-2]|uniref:bifunctional hydroxymethylpyrimidine kinase/phosphomethylpyrimidine kinase n=1 Tax=Roseovarius sp. A-2 TaxID=1570360 RepID=UPI0009B4FDA6|nr:bifunctional hydroxymethylpyrimidine kinase/phosphomethylpyrimidine kinase [Roseovarius sp. A-2]GAW36298.1 hydroxymethylpyrimidine/phosphomethylpyrimidine kinase [Roseovarius sp. A-2]